MGKKKNKSDEETFDHLLEAAEIFVSEDDFNNPLCVRVIQEAKKSGILPESPTIEELLYTVWGINTTLGFDVEETEHRTRFGKLFTGKRYCGFERCDKKWYDEGMISNKMKTLIENHIAKKLVERW